MTIPRQALLFIIIAVLAPAALRAQNIEEKTMAADSTATVDYPMIDYGSPKQYIINKIEVVGVQYLIPDILIATSGLKKGDVINIPGSAISQAMAKLWDQRYFSDVNIVAQPVGDSVNLEIYLQERPRVYKWNFEGINKNQATTLMEDMKLKRGTELSDYVIEKNILLIKKYYREKGFLNAEVTPKITNDSIVKNGVNVTFMVDKKDRVRIGELNFEGNKNFKDKRLNRTMKKTNPVGINIFKSFKLNDKEYENDKESLIDFYNSQGYRNAAIVRDSIYPINDKRIGITIELDEGSQYYIRNVTWTGNTVYPTEFLQAIFGVKKGDVYDKKLIDQRLGTGKEDDYENPTQIKSMYQNQGYLFSMVEPTEVVVGKDSIDLDIKIFEGRPFTINNVDITGNIKTDDEVIRRDIYTRPGELYNRALIMRTLRELAQGQRFDPASTFPMPTPISNDLVDITWAMGETAGDKFDISFGVGQGQFIGSVGVQLTNFAMQDLFKKGAWKPYPHGKNQQLAVRYQTNGSWYSGGSLSFTDPWLGGKKPNSLTVSAYYSRQNNSRTWLGSVSDATYHLKSAGVSAGLGRRLSIPDHYFTLYNELGYQYYDLWNYPYYFPIQNGNSNVISLKTVLARNTTNQYMYPSSGTDFSLSLSFTPPYSLFDGINYKEIDEYNNNFEMGISGTQEQYDANNEKRYKWVEYHKWLAKVAWYYPLTPDQKLVFMAKAELGYLGHYNKYKLSPYEGFSVGGDGMSGGYYVPGMDLISLRGYDDGGLNPLGTNESARVYNKYTLELRYPIMMSQGTAVWALVFAEAGNGYMSWNDFNPFTLKRSLGVGVRFYVPLFGLIGVDWGYGFDKQYGSNKRKGGKLHFTMGMQF